MYKVFKADSCAVLAENYTDLMAGKPYGLFGYIEIRVTTLYPPHQVCNICSVTDSGVRECSTLY